MSLAYPTSHKLLLTLALSIDLLRLDRMVNMPFEIFDFPFILRRHHLTAPSIRNSAHRDQVRILGRSHPAVERLLWLGAELLQCFGR